MVGWSNKKKTKFHEKKWWILRACKLHVFDYYKIVEAQLWHTRLCCHGFMNDWAHLHIGLSGSLFLGGVVFGVFYKLISGNNPIDWNHKINEQLT